MYFLECKHEVCTLMHFTIVWTNEMKQLVTPKKCKNALFKSPWSPFFPSTIA